MNHTAHMFANMAGTLPLNCRDAGCEGPVFLEWCPSCKRKHYMIVQPCPECGGRGGWIAMPKSERVVDNCFYLHYECEGCEAYRGHMA
jgi:hypothetical protein